jgi:hypothetical protein
VLRRLGKRRRERRDDALRRPSGAGHPGSSARSSDSLAGHLTEAAQRRLKKRKGPGNAAWRLVGDSGRDSGRPLPDDEDLLPGREEADHVLRGPVPVSDAGGGKPLAAQGAEAREGQAVEALAAYVMARPAADDLPPVGHVRADRAREQRAQVVLHGLGQVDGEEDAVELLFL